MNPLPRLPRFSLLTLLGALFCAALGSATAAGPARMGPVDFQTTRAQFAKGDSITIQEVVASSRELTIGDTVIVRGVYQLESKSSASLGFFLTTRVPGPRTPATGQQRQEIKGGKGSFELQQVVRADGSLHVSFYPANGGSSFGGVYFAPATR